MNKRIIIGCLLITVILRCPPVGFLIPNIDIYDILRVMFICGAASVLSVYACKVNLWAGLFILVATFSHIYPVTSQYSVQALFMVCLGVGVYCVLVTEFKNPMWLLNVLCIFALMHTYFLVLQHFGHMPQIYGFYQPQGSATIGLMGNPNGAAAALAIALPAFFRRYWCYLIPFVVVGIFISHSSNGIIGAGVATVVFIWLSKHKYRYHILSLIALSGTLFFIFADTPSFKERYEIWVLVLKNHFTHELIAGIKNQTLFGIGLGNWGLFCAGVGKVGDLFWTRLHSTYIQSFVEMGFPFLIVLAGFVVSIFRRINNHAILSLSALGSIACVCATNSVFRQNAVNGLFIIVWLAILENQLRNEKCQIRQQ